MSRSAEPRNKVDQEVIVLGIIVEVLNSALNHNVLEVLDGAKNTEVMFETSVHQKYFYILLLDFLSPSDARLTGEDADCMKLLSNIYLDPQFNKDSSVDGLKKSVSTLLEWLNTSITVGGIRSVSGEEEYTIDIRRVEFIRICGNISKHHVARLTRDTKKMKKIFLRNGVSIDDDEAQTFIDIFYERFHDDILNYHTSTIVELLNNIRWGIHEYLTPEYHRSYTNATGGRYTYKYPLGMSSSYAKSSYWGLMNEYRTGPYIKKFRAPEILKLRY